MCESNSGHRAFLSPSFTDMACQSPVGPTCLRKLDASVGASGPHDFAVRSNISRQRAVDRSQAEAHPAITCRAKRCRVHRIPPRVRDDGQRPSVGRDSESYSFDLGFGKTEIFLQMGLDRQFTDLPVGQIRFDLLQQITGIRDRKSVV